MMVCQECGVNTVLLRGHAEVCSQYEKPTLTEAQVDALLGIDPAATTAVQDLGDAINDVVADRGMKSFNAFMKKIGRNVFVWTVGFLKKSKSNGRENSQAFLRRREGDPDIPRGLSRGDERTPGEFD